MKRVQRAAWAARACGSWAQASRSEAGSQIEFCERMDKNSIRMQILKIRVDMYAKDIHVCACINHSATSMHG